MNGAQASRRGRTARPYVLRKRLLYLLRFGGLFALLLMMAGVIVFAYRAETVAWQGRQSEAAENAAQTVSTFIQHTKDALLLTVGLGQDEMADNPQVLREVLDHAPALLEVVVLDAKGRLIANGYQDKPLLANLFTIPQSQWFLEAAAGRDYLGNVQISEDNEPYVILAVPALSGAVLAARLRMEVLWQTVADIRFGTAGQAYVVTRAGAIMAHTNPAIVLANTSIAGRSELANILRAPGNKWFGSYQNFQGSQVVGASAPVAGTDWLIVAELPITEAFATTGLAFLILTAGLIVMALAGERLSVRYMQRLVFSPLEQLRQAAEHVGEADFDYDPGRFEPNEFGQVAQAFEAMALRVRDREAQVQAKAAALLAEVNERKNAEAASRESEARFRLLFEASPDAIMLIDPHDPLGAWPIVDCNEVACRMNGYVREELIGQSIDILNATPGTPAERQAYLAVVRQQHILHQETMHRHKDGRLIPIDISTTLITFAGRELVLGIDRDITGRRQAEEALRLTTEMAESANRAKSEFLSRISHELRTPMNAILGFAQLLGLSRKDPLTPGQHERVQQIVKGGQHLLGLINEILDLSQIEAGRLQVSPEPVRLMETVQEVLDLTAPLAAEHGILIRTSWPAKANPYVRADRQRLKQILLNLLANAVKFNREGGSVVVTCRQTDKAGWRNSVTDTGPGIPADLVDRLFTPFERLTAGQTPVQGTGLGLAIAKRLAELMQGRIGVDSIVGQGSTFWIELPAAESQLAQLDAARGTRPMLSLSDKTHVILYIEDNQANFELIRQVLADYAEIQLLWATEVEAGLAQARLSHPDLVLLDLHLHGRDGADVLRQLKLDPATSAIPVVVISADATPGQIQRLLGLGAVSYLTKPLQLKQFVELVDSLLAEKAL
jgi:PAS domain S-box-containing protein